MSARKPAAAQPREQLMRLIVGASGVVFGDIGTSPLYAFHQTFFGHHAGMGRLDPTGQNVLGIASLFFWSLLLVVGVKYVVLVTKADHHGEGGIFSLLAVINANKSRISPGKLTVSWGLILFGAAMMLADGLVTPAISVLSSVSGLELIAPALKPWIVPLTIALLVLLFSVQPFGTHRIGMIFGPVMLLWFGALIALAIPPLWRHPEVLRALSPSYALGFMLHHGWQTFAILGTVVLCITGGEALYADMGHFGRRPISLAWWRMVFPALVLNYLGQGAVLLELDPSAPPPASLFYAMAPGWGLVPLIALATIATIIASQALISGSFSLIQQAIALGAFPRQRIIHTNAEHEGQIYLPFVNWSLMAGCIFLVLYFRTVAGLTAAYGMAVTGTMAVTTTAFAIVARNVWRWPLHVIGPIFVFFLFIDLTFFGANWLKFADGGYVPIIVAVLVFTIMHSWAWGRGFIAKCYQASTFSSIANLIRAKADPATRLLDRSIVVLASRPVSALTDTIPPALQSRLDHLGAIYKHITILSVMQHPGVREIEEEHRTLIQVLQDDPARGSITTVHLLYGYMQNPDLSNVLPALVEQGTIRLSDDPDDRSFSILSGAERIIIGDLPWLDSARLQFFRLLLRNANTVLKYFNLDSYPDVSTEVVNLGKGLKGKSWLTEAAKGCGGSPEPSPKPIP